MRNLCPTCAPHWLLMIFCIVMQPVWKLPDAFAEPKLSSEAVQLEANRLYDNTMSPFCPGRTLSACPSEDARTLREEIFSWLEDGATEQEIRGRLRTTYGDRISGMPEGRGQIGLGWALPVVFTLIGVLVIFVLVRRTRGQTQTLTSKADVISPLSDLDPMRQKIEEELRKRM